MVDYNRLKCKDLNQDLNVGQVGCKEAQSGSSVPNMSVLLF